MISGQNRNARTTVQLLVSSSSALLSGRVRKLVSLQLEKGWEESRVDLGTLGRLTALEPLSIRINGYMLGARPPDYIAASVTWASLLSHFSARRLPTDGPSDYPIGLHGSPISTARISVGWERPLKIENLILDGDYDDHESSKRMRSGDGVSGALQGN